MITFKKKPNEDKLLKYLLHHDVRNWFFSKFKEFSMPQKLGIFEIHSRNNCLVSAPTGATKTLTSFLAILNELVDSAAKGILEDKIYAVYISPLKALNNDIEKNLIEPLKEIEALAKKEFGIRVAVRTGDTTPSQKSAMLKKPPHILITTPESLGIMLSSIKFVERLKDVQWTIIDEIHSLAENKRGTHLSLSLERLQRISPGLTRIGLSATVAPIEEIAKYLVGNNRDCVVIDVPYIKESDLKVLSPVPDLVNTDFATINKKTYELIHKQIQKHKTTLIFTNTRAGTERVVFELKKKYPKYYYEIEEKPPHKISSLIGAHHGSLSKIHRFDIEERLRQGKLRCVVCSTSLELGIDIGFIDLVILLGSPKSVARGLQRIGRAGHQLHATTKGRIIVMSRDDLVECSVLMKNAVERKIDRIHIPKNALDVLAQHVVGIALEQQSIDVKEVFNLFTKAYGYQDLNYAEFIEVVEFLAGEYGKLEERHVYGKIWYNEGKIGKRGWSARMIYMMNIGTIPDQGGIQVKIGNQLIGMIDEGFLERLHRGDIFVLGGSVYEFRFSRGMTLQVQSAHGRKPTVPSWYSEMLPLSFDLAQDINHFRTLCYEKYKARKPKKEMLAFIKEYVYVDEIAAEALYNYFLEQYEFSLFPTEKELVVERYDEGNKKYYIFHSMQGRRVNDALSRLIAYAVLRNQKIAVEVGITDHAFYLAATKAINVKKAMQLINPDDAYKVLSMAIDNTEILKRRFRHCAGRALMILRNYAGRTKTVSRQQMSSQLIYAAARRISEDFCIIREAKREVLEDVMDIKNAQLALEWIDKKKVNLVETETTIPSPFATSTLLQGYADILTMESKQEFLKRMHQMVLAKIALDKGKSGEAMEAFSISQHISDQVGKIEKIKLSKEQKRLMKQASMLKQVPARVKLSIMESIKKKIKIDEFILHEIRKHRNAIAQEWPESLAKYVLMQADNVSYDELWQEAEDDKKTHEEEEREGLLDDFMRAARKADIPPQIYFDICSMIENDDFSHEVKKNIMTGEEMEPNITLRNDTRHWMKELLKGTIPKMYSDRLVKYLKNKNKSFNR